ncbi:hypothetical protein FXO37_28911 [Capsicum annuum]|nr:hypothetical protein FXO37_28911 [Capsicum annuum]
MTKNNFFFFRSSTNDANKTPSPPLKSKEVSSWRSVSLSSGSFYDSGLGKKNFMNLSKSPHGYSKKVHPKKSGRDSSREKLYFEEMDIKQLQDNLAATVRGNDILKWEVQNALEALSSDPPKLKYLEFQNLHLRSLCCCLKLMVKFSFLTTVHQNSTCGAAENVGTAAKSNGIMHEPVYPRLSSQTTLLLGLGVKVVLEYFGHCISYAVVVSVLLGAAVSRHLSVTDPLAARRDALQSTVIHLREGFYREDQNSSASSFKGCGSSVKRSSSTDAGHLGNATVPCTGYGSTWNNIEGINSDKSVDTGRPSLALRISSFRSVVQEPEVGSIYVDRNLEHNSSLVVCSTSGLESQGGDSSTSTSANQQILDLNLALVFQEKLSDPRVTSMLKRKERHTDRELANLLQDKGLDPNFAVMLKENGMDPMILALLQRSSLDADREHYDSNPPVTDSNDVLPNHISFSEELRLQGLGKWL